MIDVEGYRPRRIPPPLWRECIKKGVGSGALDPPALRGRDEDSQFIV
ncbi:MAG: hypothetical protein GY702_25020 [Desulfobulbaceae bacterium]|nr:hypothetical protein [Desulfobulbaceae bacterium]